MKKIGPLFILIGILIALGSVITIPKQKTKQAAVSTGLNSLNQSIENGRVVKVVDGDTIDVLLNGKDVRIRLIGIDTPETVDPRKPIQCFGREASEKMHSLVDGKNVYLESDPTQSNRDKYKRLLRYVYLEDGSFVNKLMVEQGFAHEYTYNIPYKYQAEFKQAEEGARSKGLGLWGNNVCANNL